MNFVSEQQQQDRLAHCRSCEKLNSMNFCEMCWCLIPMKVKLYPANCPMGKWDSIEQVNTVQEQL
jgi:hypothetical protein